MKMKVFLTVDFDYFINADAETRERLFPASGTEESWDKMYQEKANQLIGVGVDKALIDEFNSAHYQASYSTRVYAEHTDMFDTILDNTSADEEFLVINIDFHHDLYTYQESSDKPVNCGNWARKAKELRPNMKYLWIKRPTSEESTLGVESVSEFDWVSISENLSDIIDIVTDPCNILWLIYICRSDMWSPPHLDNYFADLVNSVYEDSLDSDMDFLLSDSMLNLVRRKGSPPPPKSSLK